MIGGSYLLVAFSHTRHLADLLQHSASACLVTQTRAWSSSHVDTWLTSRTGLNEVLIVLSHVFKFGKVTVAMTNPILYFPN